MVVLIDFSLLKGYTFGSILYRFGMMGMFRAVGRVSHKIWCM